MLTVRLGKSLLGSAGAQGLSGALSNHHPAPRMLMRGAGYRSDRDLPGEDLVPLWKCRSRPRLQGCARAAAGGSRWSEMPRMSPRLPFETTHNPLWRLYLSAPLSQNLSPPTGQNRVFFWTINGLLLKMT